MGFRHSPRSSDSPWTNGLVEFQNKNLGTHLRMFHKTLLKFGQIKFICTLMNTFHNLFQHSMSLLMKLFFTHVVEFHSLFDLNFNQNTTKKLASLNIFLKSRNTHNRTKLISTRFFKIHSPNLSHNDFLQ